MSRQPASTQHLAYRRDIDGLRAIAVTAVVLFHAASTVVPSGFVGVDTFFVISGYLIGGIVFNAALKRQFSFLTFYARRARRILPALIAVVVAISVITLFFFSAQETLEFAGQSGMALLGLSNFYFWQHTDYFATSSDQEPLLMTWSLGVEEQFYLIFPFILIVIARLRHRYRLALMLLAIIVSLLLSFYLTFRYPITAFYLLPSRAWEMGVGALLAIVHHDAPHTKLARGAWTQAIGLISALGLVASLLLFNASTPFPGLAALLPVLSTAGLIQTRNSFVNTRILSTRPFVMIGQISYSWYLWHWPLMALARRSADLQPSESQMLGIAVFSLLLGALSQRFVEKPFRRSTLPAGTILLRYGVALCVALALPVMFKLSGGWPSRLPQAVMIAERIQRGGRGGCLIPYGEEHLLTKAECNPSGAAIALFGDSHASAFGPGVIQSAQVRGLAVAQFSKSACLPLLGFVPFDPQRPLHSEQCASFQREAVDRIVNDPSIRLVLVAGFWPELNGPNLFRSASGRADPIAVVTALQEGLGALASTLSRAGKRMMFVDDVPYLSFAPPSHLIGEALPLRRLVGQMLDGDKRPSGDTFSAEQTNRSFQPTRALLSRLASDAKVGLFDPYPQICSGAVCTYARGPVPIYVDKSHLSSAGSRMIDWSSALEIGE